MEPMDIRPCPFCGGTATLEINYGAFPTKYIRCTCCKTTSGYYPTVTDDKIIIERWNTRKELDDGI